MTRGRRQRLFATRVGSLIGLALAISAVLPATVLGHALNPTYTSRLPLAVYLAGAAMTVALSFLFVLARDVRATPPVSVAPGHLPPTAIRIGLRIVGLLGWAWIVAQGVVGGASAGSVAPLFLWVYGWVGLALVSALIGPAWHFLDPFSGLFDAGRLGPAPPARSTVDAG